MDSVHKVINKGLGMIKDDIIDFLQEIHNSVGEEMNQTALEAGVVELPPTWDDFQSALISAADVTAHARYTEWYGHNFWPKKRAISPSAADPDEEGARARKRSSRLAY